MNGCSRIRGQRRILLAVILAGAGLWPAIRPAAASSPAVPKYQVTRDYALPAAVQGWGISFLDAAGNLITTLFYSDGTQSPGYFAADSGKWVALPVSSGFKEGAVDAGSPAAKIAGSQVEVGGGSSRATAWVHDQPTLLGKPGEASHADGTNDPGDIVGWHGSPRRACQLLPDGTVRDYTLPGPAASSEARAINNNGDVAGVFTPQATQSQQGWYIVNKAPGVIAAPAPYTHVDVFVINSRGQIGGTLYQGSPDANGPHVAFVYDASTKQLTLLPVPAGYFSVTLGISEDGAVVGYVETKDGYTYATLWPSPTAALYVQNLLPASTALNLIGAFGINPAGQLGAGAVDANGHGHLLVLSPAP